MSTPYAGRSPQDGRSGLAPQDGRTNLVPPARPAPAPRIHAEQMFSNRPDVVPVDSDTPGNCLCGDPADYIVETNWFSGRRSRDPVCEDHVAQIVAAITEQQARRNGR